MRKLKLYKTAGEILTLAFDFGAAAEIAAGGESLTGTPTIAQALLTGSGSLTLGTPTITGNKVSFSCSGGTLNNRHELTCTVATSGGSTLQSIGELWIVKTT